MFRGIHIPKHMLSLGQDGYRTPTIEDYEAQNRGPTTPNGPPTLNEVATPSSIHHWSPHTPHHLHLSHVHILDKLHWRARVRHFTWTFFAINMATGGVANVIYNG